jgi:hypothetical protein
MNHYLKITVLSILLTSGATALQAQQGFGTNAPDKSAVVDMTASNKGVLLPRVALTGTTDNITIPSPALNLLVVNTATVGTSPNQVTPGLYYWNGTLWLRLLLKGDDSGVEWALSGNAGTNQATVFVGTTDMQDLVVKTTATERMRFTAAGGVGLGTSAPAASAALEVSSTTRGVLPPRMTSDQISAIANPAEGLMVYNTTLQCLVYYKNGAFVPVYK